MGFHLVLEGILVLWLCATLFTQFSSKISKILISYDRLGFIPRYTFFAPNPADFDLSLLIRYRRGNDVSEWFDASRKLGISDQPKQSRFFFNPYRRIEKLLFDFTNTAKELRNNPAEIRHLTDYILLLKFAQKEFEKIEIEELQFLIVSSNLSLKKKHELLFISDFHKVTCSYTSNGAKM